MRSERIFQTVALIVFLVSGMSVPMSAATPVIFTGGVVNGADFTPVFSPGILFSVFGSDLAPSLSQAQAFPLPTSLVGSSVDIIDGSRTLKAPLFFVSPGQINAVMPYEVTSPSVRVRVTTSQGQSNVETVALVPRSPRLLTTSMTGRGDAILVHPADYSLVSASQPAVPGEVLTLFLTGLGAVSPSVASGQMAGDNTPGRPLNLVTDTVTVKVDSQSAPVAFAGLAPGFAGLYQINFQVPADSPPGVPDITVEVLSQKSQGAVKFSVGSGQVALTSTAIPPTGGIIGDGGFSLSVPEGALTVATTVTLAKAVTGIAPASARLSEVYILDGLPSSIPASLTVSVPLLHAPGGGTPYILLTELAEGGGKLQIPATVQGNRMVATLPPRAGAPASSPQQAASSIFPYWLFSLEAMILGPQILLEDWAWEVAEGPYVSVQYQPGLFADNADVRGAAREIRDFLNGTFIQRLQRLGYALPAQPITLYLEQAVAGRQDCGGSIGYSTWSGVARPTIRLNGRLLQDDWYYLTMPGKMALRLKAAHLLTHALQNPTPPGVTGTKWVWMDEAVATFLEDEYGQDAPSSLNLPPYPPQLYKGRNFEPNGLEYWATTGDERELRAHGAGASAFISWLTKKSYGEALIGKAYKFSRGGDLPAQALRETAIAGGPDIDVSKEWDLFVNEENAEDSLFKTQTGYANGLQNREQKVRNLAGTLAETVVWSWNSPDLSADYVPVRFQATPGATSGLKLSATVTAPANISVLYYRVRGGSASLLGSGPALAAITASGTFVKGDELWVVVSNKKFVSPFTARSPVVVTVALKIPPATQMLSVLKTAVDVDMDVSVKGQCKQVNGKVYDCYRGETIHNRDPRGTARPPLPITWAGDTFTVDGAFTDPDGRITEIKVSATVVVNEDRPELSKLMNGTTSRIETLGNFRYEVSYRFSNIPFSSTTFDPTNYYFAFTLPKASVQVGLGGSYYSNFGGDVLQPGYEYDSAFYFFFHRSPK